jgi:hypothetical protein
MGWLEIIGLIQAVGLPLAEKLWQLWKNNSVPTQADWDALKALSKQTARDRMLVVLANNGIDPTSEQGIAFLALVG